MFCNTLLYLFFYSSCLCMPGMGVITIFLFNPQQYERQPIWVALSCVIMEDLIGYCNDGTGLIYFIPLRV